MLVVPDKFNKNHTSIRDIGTPADTGLFLINEMARRIGLPTLAGKDILDFGCGSRFADAIVNRDVPLAGYVGIDVDREMIDFLAANVADKRLSFHHIDARNPAYNPGGKALSRDTALPVGERKFDVICMFSVITHQTPEDAAAIFAILRRYVREPGWLFFTAALAPGDFGYREGIPERPTALSVYTVSLLQTLLADSGWEVASVQPRNPTGLPNQDSLLCVPI